MVCDAPHAVRDHSGVIKGLVTNVDYWENDALVVIGNKSYFFAFGSYKITANEAPTVMDALASLKAQKATIIIETTIEL